MIVRSLCLAAACACALAAQKPAAVPSATLPTGVAAAFKPHPAPDLTIDRIGAPPIHLKDFRGKVVVLAFISTLCSHCQALTQELGPIQKEYGARGVQVLESAFNEGVLASLPEFLQRFAPPFPVGYDSPATVMGFLNRSILELPRTYVPQMVFIDRRGMIRAEYPGESEFFRDAAKNVRAQLDSLLNERASAAKTAPKKNK